MGETAGGSEEDVSRRSGVYVDVELPVEPAQLTSGAKVSR